MRLNLNNKSTIHSQILFNPLVWIAPKIQFVGMLNYDFQKQGDYPLPSGASVKFLNYQTTYHGKQLESEFGGDRCFGILANMDFIMVHTYEAEGANPELLLYKKR